MSSSNEPSPKAKTPANAAQPDVPTSPVVNSEPDHAVAARIEQGSSAGFDPCEMTPDDLKREFDMFRDVLNNVNSTLRFQIQLNVTLLAACVTVLNIVPPQAHQELLNDLDRWVFIPVIVSMGVGYHGLEHHWYSSKKHFKLDHDIKQLYQLVRYKHQMVRMALGLQALGLGLMMVFVLLEFQ
jgi:hypothetical protein